MNVSESEWRIVEDRLQRLSDLLAWQWRLRISAWESKDASVEAISSEAEARTTAYIKELREVLTVPYVIKDRSTVICQRLGIRCHPDTSRHGAAVARKDKPRVLHPNSKGKKALPTPVVQRVPATKPVPAAKPAAFEPVQPPVIGRGRMDRLDRVPWPTGPNSPVLRRPHGPPPSMPWLRVGPAPRMFLARGGRFLDCNI